MKNAHFHTRRELQYPQELSVPSLAHGIPALLALARDLALCSNGQFPVVHVNLDVLFLELGELKSGGDGVGVCILVEVHSRSQGGTIMR